MKLATAAGVAAKLGTTEAKLNTAYSDSHKAQAKARVDEALKAGLVTMAYSPVLRINPPLNITQDEAERGLEILERSFEKLAKDPSFHG